MERQTMPKKHKNPTLNNWITMWDDKKMSFFEIKNVYVFGPKKDHCCEPTFCRARGASFFTAQFNTHALH